jgi:CheY-like chemotaxis protein
MQDPLHSQHGLSGSLEDLALLDILQIVAFSKKTGYLRVEGPFGAGAIVFKEGLVVCAYSWSTIGSMQKIAQAAQGHPRRAAIIREQIEISLRELASLREGSFVFQLTEGIASELAGVDISCFLLGQGLEPGHLMLGIASVQDEERRSTTALLESQGRDAPVGSENLPEPAPFPRQAGPQPPRPAPSAEGPGTVLLVDDEPLVSEVVGEELRSIGYRVFCASAPAEAAALARDVAASHPALLVVTDLGMPTSTGRSFWGGFELVRLLKRGGLTAPVLLMAESLSPKARLVARQLGIRKVAYKPALSKLDREQYRADLRDFAGLLDRTLRELSGASAARTPAPAPAGGQGPKDELFSGFLASMSAQIINPRRPVDISRLVLEAAARYLDRGALFLLKNNQAQGLGGFGLAADHRLSLATAKKVAFDVRQAAAFHKVTQTGSPLRGTPADGELGKVLYRVIGPGRASEFVLFPLLNNRQVVAILYADNGASGRPLGKLQALELFIGQAAMALENVFLHQKLRQFEGRIKSMSQSEQPRSGSAGA